MLALTLAAWLVFTPFAFGTMHVPYQLISAAIAGVAFLAALYPRVIELPEMTTGSGAPRRAAPWLVLCRLPPFWMFLALAIYLVIQACNPAWSFKTAGNVWWMESRNHLTWLPAGIDAPFEGMNAWRRLLSWLPAFLISCAVWLGISRRVILKRLLLLVVGLALAVAILGVTQKATGTNSIYWRFPFRDAEVFGPFVYRNHGAAYLLVAFVITCALGMKMYLSGERHGERSTPAPLMVFFAIVIAGGVLLSFSRLGAILVSLCALLLLLGSTGWLARRTHARIWMPIFLVACMGACVAWCLTQIDLTRLQRRFASLTDGSDYHSIDVRIYASDATRHLAQDHWLLGAGSGAFRYLSPAYLTPYPLVVQETHYDNVQHTTRRFVMRESHNDILQFTAELGLVGGSLLFGIVAWGLAAVSIRRRIAHPMGYSALVALCALIVYSTMDFPLHNPAVLGLIAFFVTAAIRWADLESSRPTA